MLMKKGTRETGQMVGQAHALKVFTKTQNFKVSALSFSSVFSQPPFWLQMNAFSERRPRAHRNKTSDNLKNLKEPKER